MKIGRILTIGLLVALAASAMHLVFGAEGLAHLSGLSRQHADFRAEVDALDAENLRLEREVELLRTDPELVEQVIRDELHMVRPDEIVYLFPETPDAGR